MSNSDTHCSLLSTVTRHSRNETQPLWRATSRVVSRVGLCAWLAIACGLASQADAQVALAEKEQAAFQSAVAKTEQCVVQIETFGGLEKVDAQLVAEGPTTGTILTEDGWIISSLYSFRQEPASILVSLPNGERVAAKMVARDFSRELALLKVENQAKLPCAQAADLSQPDQAIVGTWTIALGKTYDPQTVSQSVGIISALGRAYGRAIQTDAKISPVNYGGPLIDLSGNILGILAPISPGTFFDGDSSELYDSGIGFAIPLTNILERLPRMQKGEDIYPGKLGIVTSTQNELAGPVDVVGAVPGSPAAKANLEKGDRLVESEGMKIDLLADLRHALAAVDAGQTFRFKVQRGEEVLDLETTLVQKVPTYRRRFLGFRIEHRISQETPEDQPASEQLPQENVLRVSSVSADSPAAKAGLQVGDEITEVNAEEASIDQLRSEIAIAELDREIMLKVRRGEGDSAQVVELALMPVVLADEICPELPEADDRLDESMSCEVVELLNDVPNQAFAVVPPLADARTLGLLVVFPEPGNLSQEKTLSYWEDYCKQQGWIVAVINSANPSNWSREEFGLAARVVGKLQKSYKIDDSRVVLGGLGVGGRLAAAIASTMPDRIQGILMLGTDLEELALRQRNYPLRSIDYLLVHDPDKVAGGAEGIREAGYSVAVEAANVSTDKWESVSIDPIGRWLEGLARF